MADDDDDDVMVALHCVVRSLFTLYHFTFACSVASVFFYIVRYAESYRNSVGGISSTVGQSLTLEIRITGEYYVSKIKSCILLEQSFFNQIYLLYFYLKIFYITV